MAHVFRGEHTFMDRVVRPVEKLTYRLCGIDETREMGVTAYAVSLLVFNLAVLLFIYVILRLQGHLPLNPAHIPDMSPTVAFNTAISFTTNTNWQVYVPETAVSYLTQMLALARENFVSAAVGMAVAVAFIRGLTRHSGRELGNFWVDMTRSFLYVLLPISIIIGLFLVSQGVVQNLNGPTHAVTVQGTVQTIAQGPVRLAGDRSRSSAPTAAAPTTPTRRIPTRTRRRSPTSSRCWRCSPSRSRSPTCSGASPATSDRGGRCSRPPW